MHIRLDYSFLTRLLIVSKIRYQVRELIEGLLSTDCMKIEVSANISTKGQYNVSCHSPPEEKKRNYSHGKLLTGSR